MVFDVGDHLYAIWWCAPRAYGRLVSAFEERTTQVKPHILKPLRHLLGSILGGAGERYNEITGGIFFKKENGLHNLA